MEPGTAAIVVATYLGVRATSFLDAMLSPLGEEIGKDFVAKYRGWRGRNLVQVTEAAAEAVERSGLRASPVPGRILFPLLERAASEDDTTLQQTWAAMLANAAVNPGSVSSAFIDILPALSPLEVQLLSRAFPRDRRSVGSPFLEISVNSEGRKEVTYFVRVHRLEVQNLERLRLLDPPGDEIRRREVADAIENLEKRVDAVSESALTVENAQMKGFRRVGFRQSRLRMSGPHRTVHGLTELGVAFLNACDSPTKESSLTADQDEG